MARWRFAAALAFGMLVPTAAMADDAISIARAWVRPTLGTLKVTAGYLTITNSGASDDALLSVTAPGIGRIEMHASVESDGVVSMRRQETIAIAAGGTLVLAPGGRHLMLMGVDPALKTGATLPLTLIFAHHPPITIEAPVRMTTPEP